MGRALLVTLCLALLLECGCVGAPSIRHSRCQTQWDSLCARMRPCRTPPSKQPKPPVLLAQNQTEALRAAAGEVMASVVQIQTVVSGPAVHGPSGDSAHPASLRSGGTGVVIATDGLILTNEHVVRNATDIRVVLPDGSRHVVLSVVVDEHFDLAILRIDVSGLRSLGPARSSARFGTPVVAIGWNVPQGAACARAGVVTDVSASLQNELDPTQGRYYGQLIESTAALEPGFSGGPLLDRHGRLIGLNVAVADKGERRRGYAIPFSEQVCQAVSSLTLQLGENDERARRYSGRVVPRP